MVAAVTTETVVIVISTRISKKIATAAHHLSHQNGTGALERKNQFIITNLPMMQTPFSYHARIVKGSIQHEIVPPQIVAHAGKHSKLPKHARHIILRHTRQQGRLKGYVSKIKGNQVNVHHDAAAHPDVPASPQAISLFSLWNSIAQALETVTNPAHKTAYIRSTRQDTVHGMLQMIQGTTFSKHECSNQ
jgi:hypothetical protein